MKLLAVVSLIFSIALPAFADEKSNGVSILDPSGKEIASSSDVVCAAIEKDSTGEDIARFNLEEKAAGRLNEITKHNIGKTITVSVCGNKINQPKIVAEVSGKTVLAFGLKQQDIDCLSKAFSLKNKCE